MKPRIGQDDQRIRKPFQIHAGLRRLTVKATRGSSIAFRLVAAWFIVATANGWAREVNLIAIGDWGAPRNEGARQVAVGKAIERYVTDRNLKLDGVLLLGDNVYDHVSEGEEAVLDEIFEARYPVAFYGVNIPFLAVMGNHDCEGRSGLDKGKVRMELAYAARNSRFRIPSHTQTDEARRTYYSFDFPGDVGGTTPLVTILGLDSNWHYLQEFPVDGGSDAWREEKKWLAHQLDITREPRRWVICMAHFPIFTNGRHQGGTDEAMTRQHWLSLFKIGLPESQRHPAPDFYLNGHNHQLEHLEVRDMTTASFITSGSGGGAGRYAVSSNRYGPFSQSLYGFVHLRFTETEAEIVLCGVTNATSTDKYPIVHAFKRNLLTGTVTSHELQPNPRRNTGGNR